MKFSVIPLNLDFILAQNFVQFTWDRKQHECKWSEIKNLMEISNILSLIDIINLIYKYNSFCSFTLFKRAAYAWMNNVHVQFNVPLLLKITGLLYTISLHIIRFLLP